MESVPIHHREEFGSLLICSENPDLENQQWVGIDVLTKHQAQTAKMIFHLNLQVEIRQRVGWQALVQNGL